MDVFEEKIPSYLLKEKLPVYLLEEKLPVYLLEEKIPVYLFLSTLENAHLLSSRNVVALEINLKYKTFLILL